MPVQPAGQGEEGAGGHVNGCAQRERDCLMRRQWLHMLGQQTKPCTADSQSSKQPSIHTHLLGAAATPALRVVVALAAPVGALRRRRGIVRLHLNCRHRRCRWGDRGGWCSRRLGGRRLHSRSGGRGTDQGGAGSRSGRRHGDGHGALDHHNPGAGLGGGRHAAVREEELQSAGGGIQPGPHALGIQVGSQLQCAPVGGGALCRVGRADGRRG